MTKLRIARIGSFVFSGLALASSAYWVLAFVPMTLRVFVEADLLAGLREFRLAHGIAYGVTGLLAAETLKNRTARWLLRFFVAWIAVALLVGGRDPGVYIPEARFGLALAVLLPPFFLRERFLGSRRRPRSDAAIFLGCLGGALLSLGSMALYSRVTPSGFLAVLSLFMLVQPISVLLESVSERMLALAWSLVFFSLTRNSVFPAIGFGGTSSDIYAGCFSALLGLVWTETWVIFRDAVLRNAGARRLMLLAFGALTSFATLRFALVRMPEMDWNHLGQKALIGLGWSLSLATGIVATSGLFLGRPSTWLSASLPMLTTLVLVSVVAGHADSADFSVAERMAGSLFFRRAPESDESYRLVQQYSHLPAGTPHASVDLQFPSQDGSRRSPVPHIFLFLIDSLRRDSVGVYSSGRPSRTPALDRFADESVVFKNTFSRFGNTALSEPSLWAGAFLPHLIYPQPFAPLNSLEKLLRAEGYRSLISYDSILRAIQSPDFTAEHLDNGRTDQEKDLCKTLVEIQERIGDGHGAAKPIFAYTLTQDIHVSVIKRKSGARPPAEVYADELNRIDVCFGTFIDFLKKRNLYDSSVVIVSSDHGDSLGEGGNYGHAYSLFPETLKIPLIAHFPKSQSRPVDTGRLSFLTDIVPTLYELTGHRPLTDERDIRGRSLFDTKAARDDFHLVASSYGAVFGLVSRGGEELYTVDAVNYETRRFDTRTREELPLIDGIRLDRELVLKRKLEDLHQFYGIPFDEKNASTLNRGTDAGPGVGGR